MPLSEESIKRIDDYFKSPKYLNDREVSFRNLDEYLHEQRQRLASETNQDIGNIIITI